MSTEDMGQTGGVAKASGAGLRQDAFILWMRCRIIGVNLGVRTQQHCYSVPAEEGRVYSGACGCRVTPNSPWSLA